MVINRIAPLADQGEPLDLVDLPMPEPGPGEIRIRVSVSYTHLTLPTTILV